ncbi:MAG TPA: FkbM family methyltransferase [Gemmatimonadales bacterium]|nr:FkbM family methyltransferase [Gemmatimonadales bacterium]
MRIGRRRFRAFRRKLLDASNYRAVPRFFRVHDHPFRVLMEDAFSSGRYPRTMSIKTPIGRVAVELYSAADLSTLNLVFCRQDYLLPENTRVVVDIGSNIGLSSLYWLTRNKETQVYSHEPSPVSYERLVKNLKPFEGRVAARPDAVSNFRGTATLGIEPSGVNSSLELKSSNAVHCQVIHINEVLGPVLERHDRIDVLKIDSEGHEFRTLEAIKPEYWGRIRCVNIGCHGARDYIPKEFRYSRVASAERFYR